MISVIIPTCNRNELLGKCLNALRPGVQTIGSGNYEIIVTDDSKESIAAEFIQKNYTWAKWVKGPGKGPAANRNNGANHANGEWYVFIDDDCLPDKDLLKEYLNGIKVHPEVLAFEGAIFPDSWELFKKDMAECPINTEGGCFWSANICVNAKLFKSIGGFDERYLIAAQEDQQMKIDIEKKGNKIVFLKQCYVIHPVRFTTIIKQLKKIPIASKNFSMYAFKNNDILHYTSLMSFTVKQVHVVLKNIYRSLKAGKIKNTIISFVWAFYGLPLNILNYYRLSAKDYN